MDRNEEIKKISELLYNEYISNGLKNVSTEGCERQAINYIVMRALVKKLTLTDVVSTSCGKCDNTGVLWSKDRLSAKTCGCK